MLSVAFFCMAHVGRVVPLSGLGKFGKVRENFPFFPTHQNSGSKTATNKSERHFVAK